MLDTTETVTKGTDETSTVTNFNELNHLVILIEHNGWVSFDYLTRVGFKLETIADADELGFIVPFFMLLYQPFKTNVTPNLNTNKVTGLK